MQRILGREASVKAVQADEMKGGMRQRESGGVEWYQFEALAALDASLAHGVFTRRGGVSTPPLDTLNAGRAVGDTPAALAENIRRIRMALPGSLQLVSLRPEHGARVVEVTDALLAGHEGEPAARLDATGDAMITRLRSVGLYWAVADCAAVLLADPAHGAIGLAHAGWRGTSQAILASTLDAMAHAYGTRPSEVRVAIAPCVGPCCYEVDERVRAAFAAHPLAHATGVFSIVTVPDGAAGGARESHRVDLVASNRAQLRALGVPDDHIEASDFCTGHRRDLFYSHRMEGGRTGRFAVVFAQV
jgi:purine-nucleoside/S-methyl-5'-thioadenosine phosphorylase / adenosine deaminase